LEGFRQQRLYRACRIALSNQRCFRQRFASNGVFVLPDSFGSYGAIAIQPDGEILAGTSGSGPTAEVERFTATAHLDSTFGSSGRVSFRLSSLDGMALQPDGRILLGIQRLTGGVSHVVRLPSNGSTDTSFGTNGSALLLEHRSDRSTRHGDILIFGGLVSRLLSSGTVDT
jgi:hypothetical protein